MKKDNDILLYLRREMAIDFEGLYSEIENSLILYDFPVEESKLIATKKKFLLEYLNEFYRYVDNNKNYYKLKKELGENKIIELETIICNEVDKIFDSVIFDAEEEYGVRQGEIFDYNAFSYSIYGNNNKIISYFDKKYDIVSKMSKEDILKLIKEPYDGVLLNDDVYYADYVISDYVVQHMNPEYIKDIDFVKKLLACCFSDDIDYACEKEYSCFLEKLSSDDRIEVDDLVFNMYDKLAITPKNQVSYILSNYDYEYGEDYARENSKQENKTIYRKLIEYFDVSGVDEFLDNKYIIDKFIELVYSFQKQADEYVEKNLESSGIYSTCSLDKNILNDFKEFYKYIYESMSKKNPKKFETLQEIEIDESLKELELLLDYEDIMNKNRDLPTDLAYELSDEEFETLKYYYIGNNGKKVSLDDFDKLGLTLLNIAKVKALKVYSEDQIERYFNEEYLQEQVTKLENSKKKLQK